MAVWWFITPFLKRDLVVLTYRYRLLPTKSQHRALESILESQRQLYNAALQERIEAYRKVGLTRTYFDQTKALTEWRRDDPEAATLPANLQRATLKRLDDAYRGFFRRVRAGDKPGFPRFRGKGWFHSFGFVEFRGITFQGNRLRFKGMPGSLRVHMHRLMPSKSVIRNCVFRRDVNGWFVGFALEIQAVVARNTGRAVGVDLGIEAFAVLSDGGRLPSLRAARSAQRRLRVAQRALARKVRGSNKRRSARIHLRRRHAAIVRCRKNHLHQASARLTREYDLIVVEALGIKNLAAGLLAKDVRDAAWGKFVSFLKYKAERAGVRVIEVDPCNTSQDCSQCGVRAPKKLGDRQHICLTCGLSLDRDLNAARNILHRAGVGPGLRNVAG